MRCSLAEEGEVYRASARNRGLETQVELVFRRRKHDLRRHPDDAKTGVTGTGTGTDTDTDTDTGTGTGRSPDGPTTTRVFTSHRTFGNGDPT